MSEHFIRYPSFLSPQHELFRLLNFSDGIRRCYRRLYVYTRQRLSVDVQHRLGLLEIQLTNRLRRGKARRRRISVVAFECPVSSQRCTLISRVHVGNQLLRVLA